MNFENDIGFILCAFGFLFLWATKGVEPWKITNLLVGVGLIVLATLALGIFTSLGVLFDLLEHAKKMDASTHEQAKSQIELWTFVLPAVMVGLGTNLITAWFASKEPKQPLFLTGLEAPKN